MAYRFALVSAGAGRCHPDIVSDVRVDIAKYCNPGSTLNSARCIVGCILNPDLRFNRSESLVPELAASARGIWRDIFRLIDGTIDGNEEAR